MFNGYGYPGTSFEQTYRCYPVSFTDKPQLEDGDRVIMPPSALHRLALLHVDYPMLFELRNTAVDRVSHCGVLEFIAEEGIIYMPYWMMGNLLLQEEDTIKVKSVTLPKATYAKLQPHTTDFLDISNPKAILETTLRNYSCLTTGDTIMVPYNNKKYYIDVIQTKPANSVSIIETDCEVDFAPPLDYKRKAVHGAQEPQVETAPRFSPFTGSSRRLDGGPLRSQFPERSKEMQPRVAVANRKVSSGPDTKSTSLQSQRMSIFDLNSARDSKQTQKRVAKDENQEQAQKGEKLNFLPFTGKKYSLRG